VTISFAAKGWCDATVAIEDPTAEFSATWPAACSRERAGALPVNSKKQVLLWDGKDDRGVYVDDKNGVVVRVSLGLQPQFERSLFWSPHKRISEGTPLIRAAPEGVYVYDGQCWTTSGSSTTRASMSAPSIRSARETGTGPGPEMDHLCADRNQGAAEVGYHQPDS